MPSRLPPGVRPYLLLLACAAGCGDDLDAGSPDAGAGATIDAAGTPDAADLDAAAPPSGLRVIGTAEGSGKEGDRVECTFALDFIDLVRDSASGFSGLALGEVFRRTFDDDAPRFEFQALVGGPGTLSIDESGIELRLVGDQPPEAVPFWLSLEVMAGSETTPFEYEGEWTCSPVLVGDPMDSPIEAAGTWTAVPIN
ncbi:MAG TPA: hypothetical protein VNO33_21420 [Kofleriaceae bacterium]|nr:hypothetical protein [Kofleriaceae bacterium]